MRGRRRLPRAGGQGEKNSQSERSKATLRNQSADGLRAGRRSGSRCDWPKRPRERIAINRPLDLINVNAPNMLATTAGDHAATGALSTPAPPRSEIEFRGDIKHEACSDATQNKDAHTAHAGELERKRGGDQHHGAKQGRQGEKRLKTQTIPHCIQPGVLRVVHHAREDQKGTDSGDTKLCIT